MKKTIFHHLNRWTSLVLLLLMIAVPGAQGLTIGTVPNVNITSVEPSTFNPSYQQATIKYSISGVSGNVSIDICDGATCNNSTIVKDFNSEYKNPGSNHTAIWNGKFDNGSTAPAKIYLIQITASNQYGKSVDTDYVTVTGSSSNEPLDVDILSVNPSSFNPVAGEITTVNYKITNGPGNIYVDVCKDSNCSSGNIVKSIYYQINKISGTDSRNWNGRDSSNKIVSEGTYFIRAFVQNSNGQQDTDTATVQVEYNNNPQDNTPPSLSLVEAVANPTTDTTPNFTFFSTEVGTIIYGGDCSANDTTAIAGDNLITFNALAYGTHNNCTIRVQDNAGNMSSILAVPAFTIVNINPQDNTPPSLSVVEAVTNPTIDATPTFTFFSTEAGTIIYGGDCSANDTTAGVGNNQITFNFLSLGTHNNCTIRVQDAAGNLSSPLAVPAFTIITFNPNPQDTTAPVISISQEVASPTTDTTPSFTFYTNEAGTIIYGGVCSANDTTAIAGYNQIILNTLNYGTYSNCTVRVQDAAGNISNVLTLQTFIITNNVGIIPVITNDFANPNPFDPADQDTNISYTLNTTADVTVRILNGNTIVETIISGVSQIAGAHQVSWDGFNGNSMFSEGNYTYEIIATNNAGTDNEFGSIIVDYDNAPSGTTPVITNDYADPSSFDPDNEDASIYYTLNTSANVTVRIRNGNTIIENLLFGNTQNAGTHYVNWDGRNTSNNPYAEGNYTYEIIATNNNGQDTETGTVTVDYDGGSTTGAPNITNDYVNPNTFDPEEELARVYFTIDRSADVTVEIRRGTTVIRTLADDVYKASGTHNYTWNGRDKYGNMVSDDSYTYRIIVSNNYGTDTSSGTVRVDRDGNDDDDYYDDEDDNVGDLISSVELSDRVFDPTESETTRICFDVEEDNVDITVTVMDGNTIIRTLVDREIDRQSNYCATWNGRDRYNDIADDDIYRIKVLAEKSGESDEIAYRSVEVDTDGYIEGDDDEDSDCGGFTDVRDGVYCRALEYLKLKGIIQGYPDGTYRPFQFIQRDELLKVLLLSLDKNIDSSGSGNLGFWDVDSGAWYMPYLRTAVRLGIVRGYPDGSFKPRNNTNRVEFAKMFIEATGINVPYCNASPANDIQVNATTRWYLDYACFMIHNNLMDLDSSGRFNPGAMATRGDIAEVFYRYFTRGNNYNYSYSNNYNNNSNYNYNYYTDAQY